MAGVAEVGGAEAEEDGDGAAVATLVLQVVGAVLGTHLERNESNDLLFRNVVHKGMDLCTVLTKHIKFQISHS